MSLSASENCPVVSAVVEYRKAIAELNNTADRDIDLLTPEMEERCDVALRKLLDLPNAPPSRAGAIAVLELAGERDRSGAFVVTDCLEAHRDALFETALRYLRRAS